MAYSKENKFKRILSVQQCFKKHYSPGMTIEYIYNKYIYPEFKISRSTFFTYLNTPAESELKKIQDAKAEGKPQAKQLSLDIIDEVPATGQ
jgi:hypothetical protein